MKCVLEAKTPKEHSNITKEEYGNIMVNCPLINGRQICLWCCFHISDMCKPTTRPLATDNHPEYYVIEKITNRDFDDLWRTCSQCSNK
jgi:hypothetical protein